jgi:hypothetical protein
LDGPCLTRGEYRFRAVVLPPVVVLPLQVAHKIVDFAKAGGFVFTLGELPTGSTDNGMNDPAMVAAMDELRAQPNVRICAGEFAKVLDENPAGLRSPIRFISGEFPMLQHRHRIDGREFYWLANNTDAWQAPRVAVRGARGAASIWDCETGAIRPVASADADGGSELALVFKPYEAYWLVFDPKSPAVSGPAERIPATEVVAKLDGTWNVTYDPAIQPVMEFPMTPPAEFARGVEKPLQDWSDWGLKKFSGLLDYSKTLTVEKPEAELYLDLGRVGHVAEVWVNGKSCGARVWGPHVYRIGEALRPGPNEIRVRIANLINHSYGEFAESGLRGPVRLVLIKD